MAVFGFFLVGIRDNTDQKNSECEHFLCIDGEMFSSLDHKEFLWFLKWDPSSFPKEKVNWNQNETEMRLTPRNGIDIKSMFFLDCTNFYFSGCHFPDHFSIFS